MKRKYKGNVVLLMEYNQKVKYHFPILYNILDNFGKSVSKY